MFLTIIILIIILGLCVFVHELGHFLSAKRMGVAVDEFGFGFPPRIFGWQRLVGKKLEKIAKKEKIEIEVTDIRIGNQQEIIKEKVTDEVQEIDQIVPIKKWLFIRGKKQPKIPSGLKSQTIYSLNWIPIGGFVKIKGEQGEAKEDRDSFAYKKIWQRATILSSGVAMNFVLAFILISIGFCFGLPSIIDENIPPSAKIKQEKIQVVEVAKNSPAEKADLKMGDIIVSADGKMFTEIIDFQNYTNSKLGQKMNLKIKRGGKEMEKIIIPEDLEQKGQGLIGVWTVKSGLISYPLFQSFWIGLKTTLSVTWQIIYAIYEIFKNLVVSHRVTADVAGPVGIAVLTGQVAKMGFIYILQFTALLSINLGIINFLPFPALDGGRVLFLILEKIRGRAINQRIESLVHNVGFFLIILILVIVTFRDISRFGSTIREFFQKIF